MTAIDIPWLYFSWILPGFTNNCEIRVFALRRSGHHAIMDWIMNQFTGRYCFLNDCQGFGNPFEKCRPTNSRIASRFVMHNHLFWDREKSGMLSKKGLLLYNYEDRPFHEIIHGEFEKNREKWLGRSEKKHDVLVLRDPFNLLASKLRWAYGVKYRPSMESLPVTVQIWKEQAREFLGETGYLSNKILINYNSWFSSREYRMGAADKLGLTFTDKGINEVSKWGPSTWGDSFDGLTFDGNAIQMKVLERWKNYRNDSFFKDLVSDDELVVLSGRIFGEIPGVKEFLK